jgi:hypothetical protein
MSRPNRFEGDHTSCCFFGPSQKKRNPAYVGANIETDISSADDRCTNLLFQGARPGPAAQVQQNLGGLFGAMQDVDGAAPDWREKSSQRL